MENPEEKRKSFRGGYILLLTAAISIAFLAMIWPFIIALLLAAIGAGLLHPFYRWLNRLLRGRKQLASIVTIVLLLVLILGPLMTFFGTVANQAIEISQTAIPWVKENFGSEQNIVAVEKWLVERFPALESHLPTRSQWIQGLGEVAEKAGSFLVFSVSKMTAGTASFFLDLFIMLYALYFFLISGKEMLHRIFRYSPLDLEEEEQLMERFLSVTRATLKGSIVIGILQGGLCGIAFAFAGIEGAAFWSTVMAILSIIPGVGTALVWLPAVVVLLLRGETWTAVLLAGWCGAIVGNVDNLLRPKLVGKDAQMPDLLILLGTLGGLLFFGAVGFILGPILCSLFLAIWEIYGRTFQERLPGYQAIPDSSPHSRGGDDHLAEVAPDLLPGPGGDVTELESKLAIERDPQGHSP